MGGLADALHEFTSAWNDSAKSAERLREGPTDPNFDGGVRIERIRSRPKARVLHCSTAVFTKNTKTVGIVEQQKWALAVYQDASDFEDGCHGAVGRSDRIGHHQN